MTIASRVTMTVTCSVAALIAVAQPNSAAASNLFDMLFGGPIREGPVRDYDDYGPAKKPVKRAPAPKPVAYKGRDITHTRPIPWWP